MTEPDDLARLPAPEQDPARTTAIHRRARAAFLHARTPLARLAHLIGLADRPAVLALGVIYLVLAVQALNALYR